jgi:CRISPR-associated protein Csy1
MTESRLRAAQAALERGDAAAAAAEAGALAEDPRGAPRLRSIAFRLRADARAGMGDAAGSLDDLRSAVTVTPDDARAWNALGLACADAGDRGAAAEAFGRATAIDPGYARAWSNLGNARRMLGLVDESIAAFERAVALDPRYAHAWANLAVARRDGGDDDGAADAARRALAVEPRHRSARLVLAGLDRRAGRLDAAVEAYTMALVERPGDAQVRFALAGTLAERDDIGPARASYGQAGRSDPRILRARIGAELLLPMVPGSREAVRESRERFAAGVARLAAELPATAAAMPRAQVMRELRWTNFLLAYHGEDDRALQSAYGDMTAAVLDAARGAPPRDLRPGSGAGGRRRVAFVSAFFRDGTAGRYFESWVTGLDPARFEVCTHYVGSSQDALTERVRKGAARFTWHRGRDVDDVALAIADEAPDVVVYPELGMDATTFALAQTRLAPLQCAGWGHPVTTGLTTIDVAFTSGAMEPPAGESHYRERLVRLPGLGTRYARPAIPEARSREALGLPREGALFLVPQSLFKLMPDDDERIARVLAAVPGSRVVAFEGRHPKLTAEWRARLDPVLDAHAVDRARVVLRPEASHPEYLRINRACDAMLDSVRWSGGNTSLDAIACGLPVLTRPGAFMRGRQSAGMLALLELDDLVAANEEALVATAARLARDGAWRAELSAVLSERAGRLFDDEAPLAALADALDRG